MTDPIRQTTKTAAPALPRYIPLKVHSSYSLLEGALPIAKLAKLATAYDYPAMALTDTNNMFGALEFSEKLSASGIQPIAGISVAVDFGADANDDPVMPHASPRGNHVHDPRADGLVTLLAMNEDGYASLMKIASRAFLGPVEGKPPHVGFDTLVAHAAGIIALSGGPDGRLIARCAMVNVKLQQLAWRLCEIFTQTGCTSSYNVTARLVSAMSSRSLSRWPMLMHCHWWPQTKSTLPLPVTTKRTMHSYASRKGVTLSKTTAAG